MKKKLYKLKNWYLSRHGQYFVAHGEVYGNPKFPNGRRMRTSAIADVALIRDGIELTTQNSVYFCRLNDHRVQFDDLENVLSDLLCQVEPALPETEALEMAEVLIRQIKQLAQAKRQARAKRLSEAIFSPSEAFVMLCLDREKDYYDDVIVKKKGGREPELLSFTLHLGMFQDSVLALDPDLNIGYFPNRSIEFYKWEHTPGFQLYVYNTGKEALEITGKYCGEGFTLAPGEIRRMEEAEYKPIPILSENEQLDRIDELASLTAEENRPFLMLCLTSSAEHFGYSLITFNGDTLNRDTLYLLPGEPRKQMMAELGFVNCLVYSWDEKGIMLERLRLAEYTDLFFYNCGEVDIQVSEKKCGDGLRLLPGQLRSLTGGGCDEK